MAASKIFEGLTKKELSRIFDVGVINRVEEGTVLFRKGDIGRDMYAVLTGKIAIETESGGTREVIAELGPGALFGEVAMFGGSHQRSADAVAREFSQVLTLSEETFKKMLESKIPKQFLVNIVRLLSERLLDMHARYSRSASSKKHEMEK
ncbi:MAG: cyclic nucleotide-binding domain-containing protein [Candidatus Abyssobacteria bacterium SURF_17]|uniref:Cyclic nucleotide-binding domain-containing protein n=1 Tax=Candidatus Abyssobacteria bacterium SURF_17 TaxID=2093361 RepID=A0A419ES90_9BACT|nr:MAG: cyclic nucleotide-binding domain-containing protein [Candidatus Abyssubacteria bacterium SURF_17]